MNILIIGSGGREHTLAWKIKQSPFCKQLYIAPGNAGTALEGTNLPIAVTDFEALKKAILQKQIDLVVVGPEEPLVKGVVDYLRDDPQTAHLIIVGPDAQAARLEGSKSFAKDFMKRHRIPTAAYREFTVENYKDGMEYIRQHPLPVVLKADGLAAGKGVLICHNHIEALAEFELMIINSKFGDAGKKVVVESFLTGIEMSVFVLTDGRHYLMLPEAKDYKRVGAGDTGLNTGGMGAVSPLPFFDETLRTKVIQRVIEPTIIGLMEDNMPYKGFIFFGLMISDGDPYMIEYNCRLGDPETEVVVPRLQTDLVTLFQSMESQTLHTQQIQLDPRAAAAVVAVSGGYPGDYKKGMPIEGLDQPPLDDCLVFHSGTRMEKDEVVSHGGRVLVVTAMGENIREAAELSNYMMEQIHFDDMYHRPDIGFEFMPAD